MHYNRQISDGSVRMDAHAPTRGARMFTYRRRRRRRRNATDAGVPSESASMEHLLYAGHDEDLSTVDSLMRPVLSRSSIVNEFNVGNTIDVPW